jgi:serine/threonine protein kinase
LNWIKGRKIFDLIIFKYFKDYLDLITKMLKQTGAGFTCVAKDEEADLEIVLKLVFIGVYKETKNKNREIINKEIEIGIMISKGCDYLISYSEVFEWKDFFCFKMEYCSNGDLQTELDKERIFTEEVLILFYFI